METNAKPQLLYITGADRHMFGPTCCLLASFWHRLPGEKLYVADFGLLPSQREVFASLGVLLDMPEAVRDQFPPDLPTDRPDLALAWYSKASLLEYVRDKPFDALIWIDADITVTGDLGPKAETLAAQMIGAGNIWAAAPSKPANSLSEFIEHHGGDRQRNVEPFATAVNEFGIIPALVYLNSGFFVARDRDALARWRYLTCTIPSHYLFEQNAFNLVAYMHPEKLMLLDPLQWNLNGPRLDKAVVEIVQGLPQVQCGENITLLAHATSPKARDFFWEEHRLAGHDLPFRMKWFGNPGLRLLQKFYLDEFAAFVGGKSAAAADKGSPHEQSA